MFRLRIPPDPVSPVFPVSASASSPSESPNGESSDSSTASLTPTIEYEKYDNPQVPPNRFESASINDILPYEILSRIFAQLDAQETVSTASMGHLPAVLTASTQKFQLTCKLFKQISDDPHARTLWLITRYGTRLALYYAFKFHRGIFTPEVGKCMLSSGCFLPRYLLQLADKDYHQRVDRIRRPISLPVWMFFIQNGFTKYGLDADFRDDDVTLFERCLYGVNYSEEDAIVILKNLIENFLFVPIRGIGSPVDETVNLVAKLDVNLISGLVNNGLDLAVVNDSIMERLLWRTDLTEPMVASFLRIGFTLSSPAIKKGLQMGRINTLEILRKYVSASNLQTYAEDTVVDMFGPSIRGWNFTPEAIDFLRSTFSISDDVMERAILRFPNGISPDSQDSFPATRSYMKANPCPVWRWILRTYGPSHRLTMACFDDAISRAAAERELHALHDVFLEAGVQFRPRHVKILACRVLHRDMTANALHLLRVMKQQISASAREFYKELEQATIKANFEKDPLSGSSFGFIFGTGMSSTGLTMWNNGGEAPNLSTLLTAGTPTFQPLNVPEAVPTTPTVNATTNVVAMTLEQRTEWLAAFTEEVTGSEEWETRMKTTQLEGGPRGGAFRISKPPEDAVKFLDEAKEVVATLVNLEQTYQAEVAANAKRVGTARKGKTASRSVSIGPTTRRSTPPKSGIVRTNSTGGSRDSFIKASSTSNSRLVAPPENERPRDESGFIMDALNAAEDNAIHADPALDLDVGVGAQAAAPNPNAGFRDVVVNEIAVQTSIDINNADDVDDGDATDEDDDDTVTITPANANEHGGPSSSSSTSTTVPTAEEVGLFTNGFRIHGTEPRDTVVTLENQQIQQQDNHIRRSGTLTPEPPSRPSSSMGRPRFFSNSTRRMSGFWNSLGKNNNRR
ncbi:hypothetical protein BDR26DRAFT_922096 [Obelidium mucronatum]|nr:hypothetical protein BDR26DRAFT_922096 [Obelidium mucronatum]